MSANFARRIVWLTDVMNCGTVIGIMCCTTILLGYASLRVVAGSCRSMLLLSRLDTPVTRSSVFVALMVLRQSVFAVVLERLPGVGFVERKQLGSAMSYRYIVLESLKTSGSNVERPPPRWGSLSALPIESAQSVALQLQF